MVRKTKNLSVSDSLLKGQIIDPHIHGKIVLHNPQMIVTIFVHNMPYKV